jgi:acid-sensing ion channel, other
MMVTGGSLKNCSRKSRSSFSEYSGKTTVHGMYYVGESNRLWIERLFWVLIVIVSCYLCTVVVLDSYKRWTDDPVIVSFDSKYMPVDEIPFPAVTICPEIKSNPKIFDLSKMWQIDNQDFNQMQLDVMDALMKVCDTGMSVDLEMSGNYVSGEYNIKLLKDVAPTFDHTFRACGFGGSEVTFENCEKLFTEIITDDGVCYTFNMLNASEIFSETA